MTKMKKLLLVAAVVFLSGLGGQARAELLGSVIDISAFFPTTNNLFEDGGNRTVSGAIEYPAGTFPSYNPSWQIDVTDSQIIITNTTPLTGFPFQPGSFNGFIMTVLSGPTLTSAVADASSGFFPVGLAIVGGDQLQINFQGVNASNATSLSSIIDVNTTSAVPEPATWAMMLLGFAGLAFAFRASRRKVAMA
jgi:hypothetical protein